MSNINTIAVSGNLCADPELKGDQGRVAALRLAVNESRYNKDTEQYDEVAHYFDVSVLGNFAGVVDRKLRKGDRVTVVGKLEQQRWATEGGENRSRVVIIARDIDSSSLFLKDEDVKAKSDGGSSNGSGSPQTAAPAQTDDDIPF